MLNLLTTLHLTPFQFLLTVFGSLLIGFSKTGISGVATLAIPIMAGIYGGKTSAGLVLPMLIIGDLFAVKQYHQHANWSYIVKLAPWTCGGLAMGLLIGNMVSDRQFMFIIAVSVLVCLGLLLWFEKKGDQLTVPNRWWFAAIIGIAGGFTTMIGNAAGPVLTLYLLAMRLPKYDFIGTGAWFFALLNLAKLPLQLIFWHSITGTTLMMNVMMAPAIIGGAFLGVWAIHKIPEKPFRWVTMLITGIVAVKLFF